MKNKTVLRTFEILDLIARNPEGVSLTEIVAELDIPKSTIHDILQALVATNAVYFKNERLKTYAIGPNIFALGGAYSRTSNLITVSSPYVDQCCQVLEQPIILSKLVGEKIVHVHKQEPSAVFLKTPSLGVAPDGSDSAAGRVLIAFSEFEDEEIVKLYGHSDNAYLQDIKQIRQQGYYIGVGSDGRHTVSVSVPIFNFENKIGGVITTFGIYFPDRDHGTELELLMKSAEKISRQLGYRGNLRHP